MPISNSLYVEITSAVIGANSVPVQKLYGRAFSDNLLMPFGKIIEVAQGGAEAYFGANSNEAKFAQQYFSYISPAPASRAPRLQFARFKPDGQAPYLQAAKLTATLAQLKAVTAGNLSIQLGSSPITISGLTFASAANLADVASAIQAAIRAASASPVYAQAIVTYDAVLGAFTIKGGTGVTNQDAKFLTATAPDVGALIGFFGTGAVASPGVAPQTPLEAFIAAEQISDSFGSATFDLIPDPDLMPADLVPVSNYIAQANVKWQHYVGVPGSVDVNEYADLFTGIQSTGLILTATDGEYKSSLPMAIMAATDYDRRNATVNYMYRQNGLLTADVTDTLTARDLDSKRVNYYGETAESGTPISFFQRGSLMGGATAPVSMNVHANEQWLKAYVRAQLMSLQLGVNKITPDTAGRGSLLAVLFDAVEKAKFNGTISIGKELTVNQKVAVTDLTGDPLAWYDVQNNGAWLDVAFVPVVQPSGITDYVAKYTLAYSKNDVVLKIEGSHNLV